MFLLLLLLLSPLFDSVGATPPGGANWTVDYTNGLAQMALDFAAAAYSPQPGPCLRKWDAELVMRQQVPCDAIKNECWAFIALNADWIVFSSRGTRTSGQLVAELIETMTAPKKKFPGGGSVQHYFYATLNALWKVGFGAKLAELKRAYPHRRLLFTGHSLGGAIASLASSRFVYENNGTVAADDVLLVTFGQPRVGNQDYAKTHDQMVPNSFRVVHRYDLVAHLPYCYEMLFRPHMCIPLYNHGPWHHGTEIWYPSEEMSPNGSLFKICDGAPYGEDDECSNSRYVHFGVGDHLFYFGRDVDSWGTQGCDEERKRGIKLHKKGNGKYYNRRRRKGNSKRTL